MKSDPQFTDSARQLLDEARDESDRLHHEYIGPEHVVFALARQPDDAVLARLGIDPEQVRAALERIILPGKTAPPAGMPRPFTWRIKRSLDFAVECARTIGHDHVGVEHLVVGLMRERMNIGAQVLQELGLTPERADEEVRRFGTGDGAS
jgi:ATP-dependent Clp protease ATP-binding subunit ClpC